MEQALSKKEANEIKSVFDFLAGNAGKLTSGQLKFIKELQKYYRKNKRLSQKQLAILIELEKIVKNAPRILLTRQISNSNNYNTND